MTFTTKHDVVTNTASMETANATTENSQFIDYSEAIIVNSTLFDHSHLASPTNTTYYSTRLTGANTNASIGLAKSLSVMPGDTVEMEVYAKYVDPDNSTWTTNLASFIASIATGGSAPAGTIIDGGAAGSLGANTFPFAGLLAKSGAPQTEPKAYLNYLIFDRNYQHLDGGFRPISTAAKENGTNVAHELLSFEKSQAITIKEPGYVYIWLSNENETTVEVYFDDFKVTHKKSPVVQMDDYYPFGLTFNSYQRENNVSNKWKFQGQEHVDDLGLNWDSFKWRNQQPELGRFFNVDPLTEEYVYNSPYAFSENHVTSHIELEGLEKVFFQRGLDKNYMNAYRLERQTAFGKQFSVKLASQSKYNVLYYTRKVSVGGLTRSVSTLSEFEKLQGKNADYAKIDHKQVEGALEKGKKLILIGIDSEDTKRNDGGYEGSMSMNHEEDSHASDELDGDNFDLYEDHKRYFGFSEYYSPDNIDIRENAKYRNTRAKRASDEILKIIAKQFQQQMEREPKNRKK